jgi:hypothetical protein
MLYYAVCWHGNKFKMWGSPFSSVDTNLVEIRIPKKLSVCSSDDRVIAFCAEDTGFGLSLECYNSI